MCVQFQPQSSGCDISSEVLRAEGTRNLSSERESLTTLRAKGGSLNTMKSLLLVGHLPVILGCLETNRFEKINI